MATAVSPFESRIAEIARRRRELDAQEAEWLALVADYDRSHDWQTDGYLSCAAALREHCHLNHGVAGSHVRLARRLDLVPATAAAFASGAISRRHAQLIADSYTPARAAELAEAERTFAEAARDLDANDLRDLIKLTTDAIDGDGGASSDARNYDQNRLHISPLADRVRIDGTLDKESGEIVLTALNAMNAQLHPTGDHRHRSIRHAEALTETCRRSLHHDHANPTPRRRGRPHLSTIIDLRALEPDHPELVADIRAEAEHVGRLSRTTLERLSCDCQISRIITDGPSQITDVGRTTRNIPPKLWNALVARDQHCTEPGCDRPPGWCEAHHIKHWSKGGPTNLDNLKLLCWTHHRKQHLEDAQARPG